MLTAALGGGQVLIRSLSAPMRLVLTSDTHGLHEAVPIPDGDILIHAGDFSSRGTLDQAARFLEWFGRQPHPHKVFIAGNHDWLAERSPELLTGLIPPGCHYLANSGAIIAGIRCWGSPVTPRFFDWAFNCDRGEAISRYWAMIPEDTELLITHGPPAGILDQTRMGLQVGCEELRARIGLLSLRLHVFGHIHEARGTQRIGDTLFVNPSAVDVRYQPQGAAVVVEWTAAGCRVVE